MERFSPVCVVYLQENIQAQFRSSMKPVFIQQVNHLFANFGGAGFM